jgi:hypothetical protein
MVKVRAFGNAGKWTVGSVQRGKGADGLGRVCVWRAALWRDFDRFVGLVYSMTDENHGTLIFNT